MLRGSLLNENKRVKDFGFTQAELERQKRRFLSTLESNYKERDKTQSNFLVGEFVNGFLNDNLAPGIEFLYEFGKTVTPTISLDEINALSKNATTDENRVIVITGLADPNVQYPTEQEVLGIIKESETAKLTAYSEKTSTEPLLANLPTTPKVIEEKTDRKFGITYWTLSNGVKVVLKPTDFKADEISMRGFSPGGFSLIDDEKYKSSIFLGQVIGESGVKNLSKIELDKMMAGKRASVTVGVGDLFETINGATTPQDFETMLQLTYLRFTNVNFDKSVFDSFLNRQRGFVKLVANPGNYFTLETIKELANGDPRYINFFGVEAVDKASFDNIKEIYKDRFADASDFTFIFTGNFETEKIKPLIAQYLGNLPSINRKETWKYIEPKEITGKYEKVFYKGVDDKSQVQLLFRGKTEFDITESRNFSALGELLTIKLVEVLREEKSGVYGVGAGGSITKIPIGRYSFFINFPCGPDNVDSLIKAALNEVQKIQNGQIDDKDIAKVKEARLLKAKENYKENSYWTTLIYGNLSQGNEIIDLAETEKRINSINKEDMIKVAKKYLNFDNKIQFVLMPETRK